MGFWRSPPNGWGKDRHRFNVLDGYGNINFLFRPLEESNFSVPVNVKGVYLDTDYTIRVFERVFVGPRVTVFSAETRPFPDSETTADWPELALDAQTNSLGFDVKRDTRDSLFYPRSGSIATFRASFFGDNVGSDYSYQKYLATFSIYRGPGKHQVLAATTSACSVTGPHPSLTSVTWDKTRI